MWELLSVPREILFSRWKYIYFPHSFDIASKRNIFSHEKFYCKISDLPYFNCSSYMCIISFLIIWMNFLLGETRMAYVLSFLNLVFFFFFKSSSAFRILVLSVLLSEMKIFIWPIYDTSNFYFSIRLNTCSSLKYLHFNIFSFFIEVWFM